MDATVTGLVCLTALAIPAGLFFARRKALQQVYRDNKKVFEAQGLLEQAGLGAGPGGWHQGEVAGQSMSVKAIKAVAVGLGAVSGEAEEPRIKLIALLPCALPAPEGFITRERGQSGPFDQAFSARQGPLEAVPEAAQRALIRWSEAHPRDQIEWAAPDHPFLNAEGLHGDAPSLVKAYGPPMGSLEEVQAWLDQAAERVKEMSS